jgi:ribosome-binding protein aMBF1 (putative translation factor)
MKDKLTNNKNVEKKTVDISKESTFGTEIQLNVFSPRLPTKTKSHPDSKIRRNEKHSEEASNHRIYQKQIFQDRKNYYHQEKYCDSDAYENHHNRPISNDSENYGPRRYLKRNAGRPTTLTDDALCEFCNRPSATKRFKFSTTRPQLLVCHACSLQEVRTGSLQRTQGRRFWIKQNEANKLREMSGDNALSEEISIKLYGTPCEYCHSINSNGGLVRSKTIPNLKLCSTCYMYERKHGKLIPREERIKKTKSTELYQPQSSDSETEDDEMISMGV